MSNINEIFSNGLQMIKDLKVPKKYMTEIENILTDMQEKVSKLKGSKKEKKEKDKDAPKRGKTGYLFFCQEKRDEAKNECGEDAKQSEIMKMLGEMWKELNDEEKEPYQEKAKEDKDRYNEEMKNYVPKEGTGKGKAKKQKDPNAPKKPRSAYILFCQKNREKAKKECGADTKPSAVMAQLGAMWNKLSEKAKKPFLKEAEEDKKRYEEEKAAYDGEKEAEEVEEVEAEEAEEEAEAEPVEEPKKSKRGRPRGSSPSVPKAKSKK